MSKGSHDYLEELMRKGEMPTFEIDYRNPPGYSYPKWVVIHKGEVVYIGKNSTLYTAYNDCKRYVSTFIPRHNTGGRRTPGGLVARPAPITR